VFQLVEPEGVPPAVSVGTVNVSPRLRKSFPEVVDEVIEEGGVLPSSNHPQGFCDGKEWIGITDRTE
jgi:hypothetical protein